MTDQEKQSIITAIYRGNEMLESIKEQRRNAGEKGYRLTVDLYIAMLNAYGYNVTGGTIHDFLRNSTVEYQRGKCPSYYVMYNHNGKQIAIGYNAGKNKPQLLPLEMIDYI